MNNKFNKKKEAHCMNGYTCETASLNMIWIWFMIYVSLDKKK